MRVVSGSCKGRQLKSIQGTQTRPTTDKVKAAIFNMIGPYFHGGVGLDLFAGSGSLGIEALSRGLDKVVFVELNEQAIRVIKENLRMCRLTEKAEVYKNTAERALKVIQKREMTFDYIFLDPPYKREWIKETIDIISKENILTPGGYIVCEHESSMELPERIDFFSRLKNERYGTVAISIYKREEK